MLTGSRRAQLAERLERVFAEEWGRWYPGRKLSFILRDARVEGWLHEEFLGTARCGTESRVVGKTLTRPEKDEGAGKIGQQLHNPMFFQIIPGFELPAAAGLHRA